MSKRTSINMLLIFIALIIIFHLCIVIGLIPYTITWGGRIKNDEEMYVFEAISIILNAVLAIALLIKGNYLKPGKSERIVNIVLWIFLGIFALNTIGNLFAKTAFEKSFAVLTLLFALLIWNVLRKTPA